MFAVSEINPESSKNQARLAFNTAPPLPVLDFTVLLRAKSIATTPPTPVFRVGTGGGAGGADGAALTWTAPTKVVAPYFSKLHGLSIGSAIARTPFDALRDAMRCGMVGCDESSNGVT